MQPLPDWKDTMHSRITRALISLSAVAVLATPAVAQAGHGSDDPPSHVRREHHRLGHELRHGADDGAAHHRHGSDDGPNHRHGSDDGPNHR
jgi:hypothetical protein